MKKKTPHIPHKTGSAKEGFHAPAGPVKKKTAGRKNEVFPIVGVGASAGGLEAFSEILKELPGNIGMAFVYVQHLDATHESMLPQLLSRVSKLAVEVAKNKARVLPNHVYVIPPNYNIEIADGHLKLTKRVDSEGRLDVIDNFFRSLGEVQQTNAIGIVLSGNAYDGTRGLSVIKGEGGVTLVQSENSARFPGMPRSAIDSGAADFILDPKGIAEELIRLSKYSKSEALIEPHAVGFNQKDANSLERIFHILDVAHGVDFKNYKTTTLYRRIEKRMILHNAAELRAYATLLEKDPAEQEALFKDILISVTDFFRDPDTFVYLQRKIFPLLVKGRKPSETLRFWCVGCSTGEETYSMAINILEFLEKERLRIPVQIFASDASPSSIATARQGLYSASIAAHISAARLRTYFTKEGEKYRVRQFVREMCVFSVHDILKDPPFSRVDHISCRNVLIYFTAAAQRKVLPTFNYALAPQGFLLLGRSESINTEFKPLFSILDRKHKVYQKRQSARVKLPLLSPRTTFSFQNEVALKDIPKGKRREDASGLQDRVERLLLSQYTPPAVVVNAAMNVLQFRGNLDPYLQFPSGVANLNLLRMARSNILVELRGALDEAKKTRRSVRKTQIQISHTDSETTADIEVLPLDMIGPSPSPSPSPSPGNFLVLFHENAGRSPVSSTALLEESGWHHSDTKTTKGDRKIIEKLRKDLREAREQLKLAVEEQETMEEIQVTNEEMLSTNEEMQSINEELETAKEELQSTNEELTTVNEELQVRNSQLSLLNNDMHNFLANGDILMVMVDNDLMIRRIAPAAERSLNLIAADVGRNITHLKLAVDIPHLAERLRATLDSMGAEEFEIQDLHGIWYSARIRPYKTEENKIDGAVLTFVNIDELKRSMLALEATARELSEHQKNLITARERAEAEANQRKELERQKDEFIAILSHELRNPLSPILAHAELLRESAKSGAEKNPATEEAAEVIERHAKDMGRLLDDLLDVSSVISKDAKMQRVRLRPEKLDMNSVARRAVETARTMSAQKQINITATFAKAPVFVNADPVRIEQILVNVLQNSLKYSEPKTHVRVSVLSDHTSAIVRITDEGHGIEPELLPKIFDLFTQGSHALQGKTPGLGIGLALAQNLTHLHGGEITAESEGKGRGSTFTIKIPRAL